MTDKFEIISIKKLLEIILFQIKKKDAILGIEKKLVFRPQHNHSFRMLRYDQLLETPIGVAAGPHTQMAQNIIAAWLTGARFIELKTVQTLDELSVSKPCIDMQDEGYNCEWSQELKMQQSFDQYLNAWIMLHVLKHELGFDENQSGFIFNMSVGYNYDGIMQSNVQWFLNKMNDATSEIEAKKEEIRDIYPYIDNLKIGTAISNNITLSTMHGCPPDEIEKIGLYLINERKLHTTIKLNPTLLGKEKLHKIIDNSGFDTKVPDIAFEHDLKYSDAVNIINNLKRAAGKNNLFFGIKLTNTLESENHKNIFNKDEKMMYMSGRALHPISVNLALKLQKDFDGTLNISFSGGADAFNVTKLIAANLLPVTVCSDILKPGGYSRLNQYINEILLQFKNTNASSIEQYINKKSTSNFSLTENALVNLEKYAAETLNDSRYKKTGFNVPNIKTQRPLTEFDCIKAPCVDTCPTNQDIPDYMYYTAKGDFQKAFEVIMRTNPFPNTTGMVCDHPCTTKCTRINYDSPLRIREIKRFIAQYASQHNFDIDINFSKNQNKVAIIGAGPSGLSAAWFLKKAGFDVAVYEAKPRPGGMASAAIPSFRLPGEAIDTDIKRIENAGIKIFYNTLVDKQLFNKLKTGNQYVYIAAGAMQSRKMLIEGETLKCVIDPLQFLAAVKNKKYPATGNNIAVIGGGNTAMDAARTALRLIGNNGNVTILYRRKIADMPADDNEIAAVIGEGAKIMELVSPVKIENGNNNKCVLTLLKMKAGEKDDNGRSQITPISNSQFTMEFNTIIPAIGQNIIFDFADVNTLKTKQGTYETNIENVFIGGDALRGASTVINAIADGRKAAAEIIGKAGIDVDTHEKHLRNPLPLQTHMIKRSVKVFPVKINELPVNNRKNFNIVENTLTKEEAVKEASRCLLCDEVCNICTTVCPNLAFHSFNTTPATYHIKNVISENGNITVTGDDNFEISQKYQILHLADWCNQCGNCATFCPTAGKPYLEKPHLYFKKSSFHENKDGYFYDSDNKTLFAYQNDIKYSFSQNSTVYLFQSENFNIEIEKESFSIKTIFAKKSNFEVSLKLAVKMKIVLEGALSFFG